MRIGIFTDSYLPIRYGMETSIESFRINLEKLGHEVYIYAPYFPGYVDQNPRVFRFKSWQPSKKADMRLSLPIAVDRKIKDILNFKLDVVHAETPFTLGLLGKYIAKRQKIPMLYTHHTDFPGCIRSYFGNAFFLPKISEKLTAWFCGLCDLVIAPSKKMEDALLSSGVKTHIRILPTGANLETFARTEASTKRAADTRSKYNIKDTDKVLLTLCRIGKEKNLDLVIESFRIIRSSLSNAKLMLVGKGPYLNELREKIMNSDLKNDIIFTGFISDEEKPFYYQAADIFIYGSFHDVQALVVLEAMVSGLPIVVVDDGAFYPMVENEINGYMVNPPDAPNLAKKALEILSNKETYNRFQTGSLKISEKYSEIRLAENLIELYKESIQTIKK